MIPIPLHHVDPAGLRDAVAIYLSIGRVTRLLRRTGSAPESLGPGSLSALATLARAGEIRLGDLAAREMVAAPTMSRMVAALEVSGHIERSPDPIDGRSSLLRATASGQELVAGVSSARTRDLAQRLDRLPPDQLQGLLGGLDALADVLTEEPEVTS